MAVLSQLDQNVTFRDSLKSFQYLASFGLVKLKTGNAKKSLERKIQTYFLNPNPVVFYDSGRTAMAELLAHLKSKNPAATEVIVLGYTCAVVINAVKKAGLDPVLIDLNANLGFDQEQLQKSVSENTLAIVVQNTFGFMDDYNQITKLVADYPNLKIIEDLAICLGSVTAEQQKVGTLGDYAVLSFGSGKVISASRGGALICKQSAEAQELYLESLELPHLATSEILKHHFKIFSFYFLTKIYFVLGIGKLFIKLFWMLGLYPKVMTANEKNSILDDLQSFQFADSLAAIANNQMADLESNLQHRKAIAQIYATELATSRGSKDLAFFDFDPNCAYQVFPIQVNCANKLFAQMKSKHFYLNPEWSGSHIVPKSDFDLSTLKLKYPIIKAQEYAVNNLSLPTHIHISPKKAYKLVRQLNKFLKTDD